MRVLFIHMRVLVASFFMISESRYLEYEYVATHELQRFLSNKQYEHSDK